MQYHLSLPNPGTRTGGETSGQNCTRPFCAAMPFPGVGEAAFPPGSRQREDPSVGSPPVILEKPAGPPRAIKQ